MTLVFDIGKTHTRLARIDDVGGGVPVITDRIEYDTPQDFNEAISKMVEGFKKLGMDSTTKALCGSVPGKWNKETGVITYAPHLTGWVGNSFSKSLYAAGIDPSVALNIENDAALAGLAETVHGAGVGKHIVAYMTVSTGIGGARIVDGKIDATHDGSEPGHQIVDWSTGATLEDLASGRGIKDHHGNEIQEIGDPQIRAEITHVLAAGIHNMIVHWSPDIVVLGGPVVMVERGVDLEVVKKYVGKSLGFGDVPEIVKSALYPDAGLIGAAVYSKDK